MHIIHSNYMICCKHILVHLQPGTSAVTGLQDLGAHSYMVKIFHKLHMAWHIGVVSGVLRGPALAQQNTSHIFIAHQGMVMECPQDVDDLFEKIEDARLQLRHSDARRLFGDEDETEKGSEDPLCCNQED